jgi:hypothetical protein
LASCGLSFASKTISCARFAAAEAPSIYVGGEITAFGLPPLPQCGLRYSGNSIILPFTIDAISSAAAFALNCD